MYRALVCSALFVASCGTCDNRSEDERRSDPTVELVPADIRPPAVASFKRVDRPFGSIEIPDGMSWQDSGTQIQHPDGTVIMLQSQPGIRPEQLDEYLASYDEVQRRSAPEYTARRTTKGRLSGNVAARIEGTFDNGTRFITRDYVMITNRNVVIAVSGRAPSTNGAPLVLLVDYIARSVKAK
jgi:hypothetical protein